MSYKITDRLPSDSSKINEVADFLEYSAWKNGLYSINEASNQMAMADEEHYTDNPEPGVDEFDIAEDARSERFSNVLLHLEFRDRVGEDAYPFCIDRNYGVVRRKDKEFGHASLIYVFLLLATRLRMTRIEEGKHNGVWGYILFEELCEQILKYYLGSNSITYIVGTSREIERPDYSQTQFARTVNEWCSKIGIGRKYKDHNYGQRDQLKDGGLDIAGWLPFRDNSDGFPLFLCQCKTGTNYEQQFNTNHSKFGQKFLDRDFGVQPLSVFMIADLRPRESWDLDINNCGILFDRLRLMEYLPPKGFSQEFDSLVERIGLWVETAKSVVD